MRFGRRRKKVGKEGSRKGAKEGSNEGADEGSNAGAKEDPTEGAGNGTAEGTQSVGNTGAAFLTVAGYHLFFWVDDGVHGLELWALRLQ